MMAHALLLALFLGQTQPSSVLIKDEGTIKGRAQTLNCVGAGVACTISGSTATLTAGGVTDPLTVTTATVTGLLTAPTFVTSTVTSNASSGSNAIALSVNGARIDFGAGANDYCSSNGITITCVGSLASESGLSGSEVVTTYGVRWGVGSVGTCDSTYDGHTERRGGGATGTATKLCLCRSDGASNYAWKNISTVFASDAASIGTATVCP